MAFEREWPDKQFVKEVEEAFPDQGIANVEEARVCLPQTALLPALKAPGPPYRTSQSKSCLDR